MADKDLLIAVGGHSAVYKRDDGTYYLATVTEPEDPAAEHGTGSVRKITEMGLDRRAALDKLFEWEG